MARQAGSGSGIFGRLPVALACAAIVVAIAVVYRGAGGFAFVFDDQGFLHDNPPVLAGLSRQGLRWALTSFATGNWHPLTWLSHMLDVQLFGLNARGHHLVNVGLHALSAVLLLLVLRRMTGALWPSAFVAALFAVHPLHVESVAWVAERKDVLSGLLWVLSLTAYARYAASPGRGRLVVVLCYGLGLMAKPMVVTLPAILLLLDWWPLGRLPLKVNPRTSWWPLIVEKLPLFALAGAVSLVTVRAQRFVGAIAPGEVWPLPERLVNAVTSTAIYVGQSFWPAGLAAYYPLPASGSAWQAAGALLLLAGVTAAALAARGRLPALTAGWLWYLVTLAPVIGVIQVGGQAHADRYLYLPLIGLGLMAAWGVPQLARGIRAAGVVPAAALGVLVALAFAATRQSETWRTPQALYGRMLEVTSSNWVAHNGYGQELQRQGRLPEAIGHFRAAVAINHGLMPPRRNLAFALDDAGQDAEAIEQLGVLLKLSPENAEARYRLGLLLGRAGRATESLAELREATRLRPWFPDGWDALGVTCASHGLFAEAEAAFREALRIDPGNANASRNLERLRALH